MVAVRREMQTPGLRAERAGEVPGEHQSFVASTLMRSVMSSASAGIAYFIPHSLRLMVATNSPPHIGFFVIGWLPQLNCVAVSVTGRETPRIVRSPVTDFTLSPSNVICEPLK